MQIIDKWISNQLKQKEKEMRCAAEEDACDRVGTVHCDTVLLYYQYQQTNWTTDYLGIILDLRVRAT